MKKYKSKPSFNQLLTTAACLLSMLFISAASASQETALELYQNAENARHANQLESAIDWYTKAIQEYSIDGEIIIETTVNRKIIAQGRASKLIDNVETKKAAYYPNRHLKEVQEQIEEQHRASHPPVLQLSWISLQEPTGDNVLDGGESGSIAVEIQNSGESTARDVKLELGTDKTEGIRFSENGPLGELDPGQSKVAVINLDVALNVPLMTQQLTVKAKEKGGYISNELEIALPSKTHQPDNIIVAKMNIEDLNGDGLIEPTEMVTVKATVANTGKGISNNLTARFQLGKNIYIAPDSKNIVEIGKIFPGGTKVINFSFFTNHKFSQNQPLPVSLQIVDQAGEQKVMSDLGLTINIPSNKVVVNVLARDQQLPLMKTSLVDVDMSIPEGKQKNEYAVAVVIGNRNYRKPGLPRVEYAHNDSRIMKEYLVKTMGFDANNIFYLEDATSANFSELFGSSDNYQGKIFNHIKPGISELFVYYSGHGAPDIKSHNSFFVPVDADPNYISLSGYSLDLFYKNIAKSRAKQIIVVLDTCFSGNSDGGYLLGNISPAMVNVNKTNPNLNNSVIFSSTRLDQVSVWFHEKRHSLFTYYFLKGLTGAADNNKDLLITSTELGNYVKDSVPYQARRINGFEQDPTLLQNQDIDLVNLAEPGHSIINTAISY